jgi:hypothetical protein
MPAYNVILSLCGTLNVLYVFDADPDPDATFLLLADPDPDPDSNPLDLRMLENKSMCQLFFTLLAV